MSRTQINSMSSSDLIDAKFEEHQMISGSKHCPNCGHKLNQKQDWFGLPAGVKFDPTDQELIEHLEAKVYELDSNLSHPLIDEFIPTIEGEDGICYTHPEKLPGVTRNGRYKHFFHRPSKAYTTGTRKRRKIQNESDHGQIQRGETRWHKTGKTRPVIVNGKQKGCKKILVLYTNFGKHRKPEKTNWVMHQYHLGELEEEKEGELVVSKIFYQTQPRQCNWSSHDKSGSSSSKEIVGQSSQLDHQMDNYQFAPFSKSFDQIGMTTAEATTNTRDVHVHNLRHDQNQIIAATSSFHINQPTHPISAVISPHHRSGTLINHDDLYHMPRIVRQSTNTFQQQQQQHTNMAERSDAGLEELIMGCNSSGNRQAQTINPHPQEPEWIYWPPPDNQGHHHHQ